MFDIINRTFDVFIALLIINNWQPPTTAPPAGPAVKWGVVGPPPRLRRWTGPSIHLRFCDPHWSQGLGLWLIERDRVNWNGLGGINWCTSSATCCSKTKCSNCCSNIPNSSAPCQQVPYKRLQQESFSNSGFHSHRSKFKTGIRRRKHNVMTSTLIPIIP